MFTEVVTDPTETRPARPVTEATVVTYLHRARRRAYQIEPLLNGGCIVRFRQAAHGGTPRPWQVTLTPQTPADPTADDLAALRLIADAGTASSATSDDYALPVLQAGTHQIPPAQAERLTAQGFLTEGADGGLHLTLSARLTLLAAAHARMDGTDRDLSWCACGMAAYGPNADRVAAVRSAHLTAAAGVLVDALGGATD
ncbi:hypothetical protein GCM10010250_21750 [Streptomyces althioticus]|uniref:hypothetical protein n=1 Tax=Streptomyces althioticus TaxID=83380 RepID=UPI00187424F7|nr:hypothetical protein GCM10010250_21750 [Streptomyces althioticus]